MEARKPTTVGKLRQQAAFADSATLVVLVVKDATGQALRRVPVLDLYPDKGEFVIEIDRDRLG